MPARRSARESSIHKATDGRWHGYVTIGVRPDGSRDRRHREGATRAEVVAKLKELEQGRDAGVVLVAGKRLTVGEWMEQWLVISAGRVRPRTLGSYEVWVRRHIQPAVGGLRLDRLQPEHLEALYAEMRRKGLAPASALKVHRILHRALAVALQRGHVGRNVAKLVDAPRVPHEEIVPLSSEEARRLIQEAQGSRNGARWTVALALGLRQGEVLGAQWRDVDLEAGTWRVRRQLQRHVYRHGCGGSCGQDRAMRCP
ncbi:MAG: integrase family protein [Frankiales bacterium]|nr:integrase family protein [Frankiales bacterium]